MSQTYGPIEASGIDRYPLLTKVWAAAMAEARPYGGNPDAWATRAAEHVISKFPPITADRLEDFLAKRHCPCCDWYGAPIPSFPADASETRSGVTGPA